VNGAVFTWFIMMQVTTADRRLLSCNVYYETSSNDVTRCSGFRIRQRFFRTNAMKGRSIGRARGKAGEETARRKACATSVQRPRVFTRLFSRLCSDSRSTRMCATPWDRASVPVSSDVTATGFDVASRLRVIDVCVCVWFFSVMPVEMSFFDSELHVQAFRNRRPARGRQTWIAQIEPNICQL